MKKPYLTQLERGIMINNPENKWGKQIRKRYEDAKVSRQLDKDMDKALSQMGSINFIDALICYFQGWKSLDKTPPDERVQVLFSDGSIWTAFPTYYPFEMKKLDGDERKPWGWKGTPVFYEDGISRWDGGWMRGIGFDDMKKDCKIVKWRRIKINKKDEK